MQKWPTFGGGSAGETHAAVHKGSARQSAGTPPAGGKRMPNMHKFLPIADVG